MFFRKYRWNHLLILYKPVELHLAALFKSCVGKNNLKMSYFLLKFPHFDLPLYQPAASTTSFNQSWY